MKAVAVMIVGTDTGVGKTYVAVRLVRALVRRGVDVGVMKPFESGVSSFALRVGRLGADASRLLRASGNPAANLDLVSPYRFREALSPAIAAERVGVAIDFRRVARAFDALRRRFSRVVIEGAGGLYSPLGPRGLNAVVMAKRLRVPVILVAANRLGTLSHVLLARETLARHGIPLRAVVLTQPSPSPRIVRETNAAALPFAIRADSRIGHNLVQALGW
ncbi:MAG: dethiobiotin synthase [Deltaproteobacteria bacterium]|nr:dethiobiotin synthase [Deltaproteobacteria bacterium]